MFFFFLNGLLSLAWIPWVARVDRFVVSTESYPEVQIVLSCHLLLWLFPGLVILLHIFSDTFTHKGCQLEPDEHRTFVHLFVPIPDSPEFR
jgi:hypothetical protein